jgi:hypothetical protein
MRHIALLAAGTIAAGALAPATAQAEDTIRINGLTLTCTTRCVVTQTGPGQYSVTDCCGGTVSMRLK